MIAIILAGGRGTRLSEETEVIPKPLVRIGDKPILWHIIEHLALYGIHHFVIAGGYKCDEIHRYIESEMRSGDACEYTFLGCSAKWDGDMRSKRRLRIAVLDTGLNAQTGDRIRRALLYVRDWCATNVANFPLNAEDYRFERCLVTYGDGLSDVDIDALRVSHLVSERLVTVTAVRPPARFGRLEIEDFSPDAGRLGTVTGFAEKPHEGWINGGYFIVEPQVLDHLEFQPRPTVWEGDPLRELVLSGEVAAYRHEGFWCGMDTLREKRELCEIWARHEAGIEPAPWTVRA